MGDDPPIFHGGGGAAVIGKAALDNHVGTLARLGVVALLLNGVGVEVVRQVFVNQRGVGRQRLLDVDDGGQHLDIHKDSLGGILGLVACGGDHDGDRFTHVPHLAPGEWHLRARVEDQPFDGRRRHQQRTGFPVISQVVGRVDCHDAGHRARGCHVDPSKAGMGVVAAHERDMQHPRQVHVIGEGGLPGQQPRVLVTFDRLAEIAC